MLESLADRAALLVLAIVCTGLLLGPGIALLRAARQDVPPSRLPLAVGLSLIANHWLFLLLLHRDPWLVRAYAAAGFGVVTVWLLRTSAETRPDGRFDAPPAGVATSRLLARCLCGGVLVYFALVFVGSATRIFTAWDAVVSWNRWAGLWVDGAPEAKDAGLYPQLVPINWAMIYQGSGSALQFGPRAVVAALPLLILWQALHTGRLRDRRSGRSAFAAGTAGLLLTAYAHDGFVNHLASGYVEVPVAFLAFLHVAAIGAWARTGRRTPLVLAAVLAGGAALTKQGGLLFPLAATVAVVLLGRPARGPRWRPAASLARIALSVCVPWYALQAIELHALPGARHLGTLTVDLHEGRGVVERLVHAAGLVAEQWTRVGLAGVVVLLAIACRDRFWRTVVLVYVVPYALLWAIGFSYDGRNLTPIVPIAGFAAGRALFDVLAALEGRVRRRLPLRTPAVHDGVGARARVALPSVVIGLLLASLALGGTEGLEREQGLQLRGLGNRNLNDALYTLHAQVGLRGRIATDYHFLKFLPGLGGRYLALDRRDAGRVRELLADRTVSHFLVAARPHPSGTLARDLLLEERARGRLELVLDAHAWLLFAKPEAASELPPRAGGRSEAR